MHADHPRASTATGPSRAPCSPSAGPRRSSGDVPCSAPSSRRRRRGRADRGRAERLVARAGGRRGLPGRLPFAGCRLGGGRPPREPRGRAEPRAGLPPRRRDRCLHDRWQPAQAEQLHHRDAVRRRHPRRLRPRCRGGRHLGRGQHRGRPHDRLRQRRVHAQAADEPALRRARAAARRGHRPALRTTEPVRPAAVPGGPVPLAAGHRGGRGHRGRGPARAISWRSSGAVPSRWSTAPT